jgi:Fe-S oxidoreductase
VLLWPDTFNNHFFPAVGQAAVDVLEAAGYQVAIPAQSLCCGRPLYDFGMLTLAKSLLRQIIETLRPQIEAGVPIVGLEPACLSAFRDELIEFFPEDALARKLSAQSLFFSEFLDRHCGGLDLPKLWAKALVQVHCHHHAVIKPRDEWKLLDRLGLDYDAVPSGCCGMAGSFGFEDDKYEVSMTAGERVLLPAVRDAPADTLVLADGFSCREQIEQGTGRSTLHAAELTAMALGLQGQVRREAQAQNPVQTATALGLTAFAGFGLGLAARRAFASRRPATGVRFGGAR